MRGHDWSMRVDWGEVTGGNETAGVDGGGILMVMMEVGGDIPD